MACDIIRPSACGDCNANNGKSDGHNHGMASNRSCQNTKTTPSFWRKISFIFWSLWARHLTVTINMAMMAPAVQPTKALPIGDRMSCLIIDYVRFPMRPMPKKDDARLCFCSRLKYINRKEAPDCRRSWRCQTSMIDRLNDREIAARLGRWPRANRGAIIPLCHRASI